MGWDGEGVLAGRYRKLGLVGRGGMGSVWRAYDIELEREVAVKELRVPEHVSEAERAVWYARMEREARAAARLRHPGIVTVHDRVVGEDGRPWIVMELVGGRSLEQLLAERRPLPGPRVAAIGLAMLDALSAAHAQGVVHRDVKPANVLLDGDRVVLTDFGIAAVEGDATLTRSGAVLGTPAYMSPEQVHGESASPASDLWALGATLYAAAEGRPPFTAPTHGALFIAIATKEPAPPQCGGPLAELLNGLLRKDPAARPSPAQARELLNAVTAPGYRPPAQDGAHDLGSATRADTLHGARGGRDRPVAVRGAFACAWLAVAGTLLLPHEFQDAIGFAILTESAPPWSVGLLGLAIILSIGLRRFTRRPVLVLAAVAVLNVALILVAPVDDNHVLAEMMSRPSRHAEIGYAWAVGWLASAGALMFAFGGTNGSLASRIPSPEARRAVLGTAVIVEGAVAVLWPGLVFRLLGMDMDVELDLVGVSGSHAWVFGASLGLAFAAWLAVQAYIWSGRRGIGLSP
ncbi:protein kinase [Actinomadura sp. NPDC000600]|uniref:serine/threonine-protein kinase n=1 Tax=Actinomadura sp. NPDC000600 TaxID=3154262 RepID=UPI003398C14E